ncbi:hypothetical protein Tco_0302961 [Tanacetum coccineum]
MAALTYKDDHNKIAYLGRERGCEDFTDILSYLNHSPLRYALTHAPPVMFDSLVKQFWATAVVRPNAAGSHDLVVTIDGREVVVTESLIRTQLQFDDANGIFDMPINDILEGMGVIGYPADGTLTFLKNHLSPQWRFLVHTIMQCLSPKCGSWNQFPSSIATALICLSTGRVYNFSRFILEGMIRNVKAKKNKFLVYPRFLQMIVAIETANRTPRPTFGFTRKMFANMKFKWEGQPIPLTPPMLAIAAAGNDAAGDDDAANEENVAANEAADSAAEAPTVSPVREPTPERQPETEWVVPNPVSPVTDWRPWPSVPAHSPIRDPTPVPASPPTPPAQTFIWTPTHGGFHVEVTCSLDVASTPTADADGRAEDPVLLTSLSAKLDRCMGRLDSLETELGTTKKIMGGAILTLVSRVKKLEKTVKQLRTTRLVGDVPAAEGDVDIQDDVDLDGLSRMASAALGHNQPAVPSEDVEEREEEEVPLRRKRSAYRRARTEFSTPAFEQFQANLSADGLPHTAVSESAGPSVAADKGKAPLSELDIPTEFLVEDALARKRFEEEQASERLVQQLRAEDLAQEYMPNVSEERAKELDDLMMRMTETDWLHLMMQVGSNPALAKELLGADVNEGNFIERMTALIMVPYTMKESQGYDNQKLVAPAITEPPSKRQRVERASSQPASVPAATTHTADDPDSAGGGSSNPAGSAFGAPDSAASSSPSNVSTDHIPIDVLFASTSGGIHDFFLESDEEEQIGLSRVAADPDSMMKCLLSSLSGRTGGLKVLYYYETVATFMFTGTSGGCEYVVSVTSFGCRGMDLLAYTRCWICSSGSCFPRALLCHGFNGIGKNVYMLYPKSSVHVLDLTNGKTVYMFVDKIYPIRATLLERMLRHKLTVPPSYCRDVVVAGNVIQTVQTSLRQSFECLASAPFACTARQMVFSSPWLTAKKESGSPLQTALVCNSNPLIALASPEQTTTGKDLSNPLHGCDGLPKTVRVFQFTLDSCSEKLDWFLLHQDWKLLFFGSAVHRVHAVSVDAADLDVASTVSAAFIIAAGYLVSAGICFCYYSILLLREDLSRNLALTESTPMISAGSSSSIPADYVPAGHVLISADRYRIC